MFAQTDQGAACANARRDWRNQLAVCLFWTRLFNGQKMPFLLQEQSAEFPAGMAESDEQRMQQLALPAGLRMSTDMPDVNSQKLGVLGYCAVQKLGMPDMISDTISGKVDLQQREIGKLLGRVA